MPQKFIDITGAYVEADVTLITDSTGKYAFCPDALAVSYTYDTSGNLSTELRGPDGGGFSYLKTYTFVSGKLSAESAWVKQ